MRLLVIPALLSAFLFAGVSSCSEEAQQNCNTGKRIANNFHVMASQLENIVARYKHQTAMNKFCELNMALFTGDSKRAAAFMRYTANHVFAETEDRCVEWYRQYECTPRRHRRHFHEACGMRTYCTRTEAQIVDTRDGYNDAMYTAAEMETFSSLFQAGCTSAALGNVETTAELFTQAAQKIRGPIDTWGQSVLVKAECE